MTAVPTEIAGVYLMEGDRHADERGHVDVASDWGQLHEWGQFHNHKLNRVWTRSLFVASEANTLRGLHYQKFPKGETKLVKCVSGAIFDVVVDVRPESPTYGRWKGFDLDATNNTMLYIPEGVAHGYQCDVPCVVHYLILGDYCPELARGIIWDDPDLHIHWPSKYPTVSEADRMWPRFKP